MNGDGRPCRVEIGVEAERAERLRKGCHIGKHRLAARPLARMVEAQEAFCTGTDASREIGAGQVDMAKHIRDGDAVR